MRALRALILALAFPTLGGASEEMSDGNSAGDLEGVEQMVVYGVRTGELDRVPGAATNLIFADDFVAEHKSLTDLLSETEGISVRRFGGAGDRSEISIRGSSASQVVITLDGARANSLLTGGFDLSRICLPLLERVEITRGAGTTAEGSGAVGGVVNIVTRGAIDGPETRLAFSGGSFETFEGSLVHSDTIGEIDFTVGYCGFETEGDFEFSRPTEIIAGVPATFAHPTAIRLNNDRVQHGGTFGLHFPLGSGEVGVSNYTVYSSGGEPGIDSGNGASAGQALEARSRDLSTLNQLGWTGSSPMGVEGDFQAAFYHRFESSSFRNPIVTFRPPIDVEVHLSTFGARLEDTWDGNILDQAHQTDINVDFAHDRLSSTEQSPRERPRLGAALSEALTLFDERLVLSAGVRVDWTQGFGVQGLPSFGVVVSPFPWVRIRAQAGRAYRAPNFDELFHPDEGFIRGNADLLPEDAWNFGAGLEVRFARIGILSKIDLRAGWFRREIDESILWVLVNADTIAPINTGSATTDGFELSAAFNLIRLLRISANHTETQSRRDLTGKRLSGQPSHETSARVQLGHQEAWKLIGEVQRVGVIFVDEGGGRRLPARTIWNASAAVNLAEMPWLPFKGVPTDLWLFVEIDNITDKAVRDVRSFPQPGRHLTGGLEVVW
ncbi:MAG: TonB-dependent receptor [Myxococcales bacterium]|nr:TonB-dependent receptor [Myxococcales bacterium]HIK84391.1 TonB-dependent receptor [Myxococcales bacterium]